MKKLLKKSLIIAYSMILMSANVMAASCSSPSTFQWTGIAPKAAINKGRCIRVSADAQGVVPQGAKPIVLHNPSKDGSKHDIRSSTELAFTVVEQANNIAIENKIVFNYQIINLKVGKNGGPLEDQSLNPSDKTSWQLKLAKNNEPAVTAPNDELSAYTGDTVALTLASEQFDIAADASLVVQVFMLILSAVI